MVTLSAHRHPQKWPIAVVHKGSWNAIQGACHPIVRRGRRNVENVGIEGNIGGVRTTSEEREERALAGYDGVCPEERLTHQLSLAIEQAEVSQRGEAAAVRTVRIASLAVPKDGSFLEIPDSQST